MSDGHTMSVRFPTKRLIAEMKKLARVEGRSLNWIIVKACEDWIERRHATGANDRRGFGL